MGLTICILRLWGRNNEGVDYEFWPGCVGGVLCVWDSGVGLGACALCGVVNGLESNFPHFARGYYRVEYLHDGEQLHARG